MKIEEEIKQQSKWSTANQKAAVNILFTASWLTNKQQGFFKPYGITLTQYNILRILKGQFPKAISASEIKVRMIDKNSDVSRLLDRLETKNLITKKVSDKDKRATDVSITEEGLSLLTKIGELHQVLNNMLELSESESEMLSSLLDKSRG